MSFPGVELASFSLWLRLEPKSLLFLRNNQQEGQDEVGDGVHLVEYLFITHKVLGSIFLQHCIK